MTTFEEIQDKGLLAAKGLQSLLMETAAKYGTPFIKTASLAGSSLNNLLLEKNDLEPTQAPTQTPIQAPIQAPTEVSTEVPIENEEKPVVGSGLSSLLEGFKKLDPYTRAEIGGLVGQVIGEAITGREAPKMAETIRQVPAVLRERKEKQEEKQIEKLKLLRETQKQSREEQRKDTELATELIKLGLVEIDENNLNLVKNISKQPYASKYIKVNDKSKPIFNQKQYLKDVEIAKKSISAAELHYDKMDIVQNAIKKLLETNSQGKFTRLSDFGDALTASNPISGTTEKLLRLIGTPEQITAQNYLEQILSNKGFQELQEMRDASPTGGALGQVTEMELKLLMNAATGLSTGMQPKEFFDRLTILYEAIDKFKQKHPILSVDTILNQSILGNKKVFIKNDDGSWKEKGAN